MVSLIEADSAGSVEQVEAVKGSTNEQLQAVKEISRAAGKRILELREAGLEAEDVVLRNGKHVRQTNADIEASRIIIEKLSKAYPDFGLISQDQMGADPTWYTKESVFLINPIDNTKEFERGSSDFHIQIGLLHRNEVILSVSYYPATDTFVWAAKGQGSWMESDGGIKQLKAQGCPQNILIKSTSHDVISPYFPDFEVLDIKPSSTERLLLLIEGKANLYISLGALGPEKKGGVWNYANACIAEEAGLFLRALDGTELDLRDKDGLLTKGVVITSSPALLDQATKIFGDLAENG